MAIPIPTFLKSPIETWVPCQILTNLEPSGYAVVVNVDGAERHIVTPAEFIRNRRNSTLPTDAELRVIVVAELPDGRLLAELPSPPTNGSQRVSASAAALQVA